MHADTFNTALERCGPENVKGFGRLLLKQIHERTQAAEAAGLDPKGQAIILLDHEFGALVFFLANTEFVVMADSKAVELALSIGRMLIGSMEVYSESFAVSCLRNGVEKSAAGRWGLN